MGNIAPRWAAGREADRQTDRQRERGRERNSETDIERISRYSARERDTESEGSRHSAGEGQSKTATPSETNRERERARERERGPGPARTQPKWAGARLSGVSLINHWSIRLKGARPCALCTCDLLPASRAGMKQHVANSVAVAFQLSSSVTLLPFPEPNEHQRTKVCEYDRISMCIHVFAHL